VLDRVGAMTGMKIDTIRVREKLVVCVGVEEARRKPCSDVVRNEFWIRKGSNNRRHDTEQMRALMADRVSVPGAFD
jgi:predicted HTH transcriptional regulator